MSTRPRNGPNPIHGDMVFGPYRLTEDRELLCPDETRVQLSARLADILIELVRKDGAAVSRIDLLDHCWPESEVSEDNLTRAIADLRKVFRAQGADPIETVYGLGYRLNTRRSGVHAPDTIAFCREAWHRIYQRRRTTLDAAEDLFRRVVAEEREYVPAWLGLAETQIHRMQLGYATTMESAPTALEALDRALRLDPETADALALKGLVLTWAEWDFRSGAEALKSARELSPDGFLPNQAAAWHELAVGDLMTAERFFRAATAARPLAATAKAGCALARMYIGDQDTALEISRKMIEADAYGAVSLSLGAIFEAAMGDPRKAITMAEDGFGLLPESPVAGAILAYALARDGRSDDAEALLESTAKGGSSIGLNTMAAPAWMELGEAASAMAALESGIANRCVWLLQLLRDPRLDALKCAQLRADLVG